MKVSGLNKGVIMTKMEAFKLVSTLTGKVQLSRDEHVHVMNALNLLRPEEEKNQPSEKVSIEKRIKK